MVNNEILLNLKSLVFLTAEGQPRWDPQETDKLRQSLICILCVKIAVIFQYHELISDYTFRAEQED